VLAAGILLAGEHACVAQERHSVVTVRKSCRRTMEALLEVDTGFERLWGRDAGGPRDLSQKRSFSHSRGTKGLQDRVIVYSRPAATDPRPKGMAELLGALLATTVLVVVFLAVLVGIRAAAAHQRSGESYELTPRRVASSLSVCLLVVSAALSTLSTPSPGAIAATHVANVALFVSVGWWLWTLRVDGVLAVPPVSLAKKREATAAPRPRQDSETPRTPRPSPPQPEEGQG
jgi:hypothetical protein